MLHIPEFIRSTQITGVNAVLPQGPFAGITSGFRNLSTIGRWTVPVVTIPDPSQMQHTNSRTPYNFTYKTSWACYKHVLTLNGTVHEAEKHLESPPKTLHEKERILEKILGSPTAIVTSFRALRHFRDRVVDWDSAWNSEPPIKEDVLVSNFFINMMPDLSGRLYLTTSDIFASFIGEKPAFLGRIVIDYRFKRLLIKEAHDPKGVESREVMLTVGSFINIMLNGAADVHLDTFNL